MIIDHHVSETQALTCCCEVGEVFFGIRIQVPRTIMFKKTKPANPTKERHLVAQPKNSHGPKPDLGPHLVNDPGYYLYIYYIYILYIYMYI